jgi:hypothetical protein
VVGGNSKQLSEKTTAVVLALKYRSYLVAASSMSAKPAVPKKQQIAKKNAPVPIAGSGATAVPIVSQSTPTLTENKQEIEKTICSCCKKARSVNHFRYTQRRLALKDDAKGTCRQCISYNKFLKTINTTRDEVDSMLIAQKSCCLVCAKAFSENVPTHLDVCGSGDNRYVRGIVCKNCNRAIELLNRSVGNLLTAATYISEANAKENALGNVVAEKAFAELALVIKPLVTIARAIGQ